MINAINSIQKYNQVNPMATNKKRICYPKTDSFNFKGSNVQKISGELIDYRARYLTLSLDEAKTLCHLPYGMFEFKRKNEAWERWEKAITDELKRKLSYQDRMKVVADKEIAAEAEKVAAKQEIDNKFLKLLDNEKSGQSVIIPNAIMMQGKSDESKKELSEWISQKADLIARSITHDSKNPSDTIEKLYEEGENAETKFKTSKKRTILRINNIEDLLGSRNEEDERVTANFKAFIQDCSKNYHTTVLFDLKNPANVDPAAIAPHRVEVRVEANKGLTESDKAEKSTCQDWLEAYDILAKKGREEWNKYKSSWRGMFDDGILGCSETQRFPS